MRSVSTRFTGLLLVVLGAWGGLVPFVGHYFHFALGPDKSWDWTTGRLYLDVLPAVAVILGGLNLMSAGPRRTARLGALLALAGGVWFTIGPEISQLWQAGGAQGAGHGSPHRQMLEMLTYHTGLGVVVAALAAYALPRFTAVTEAVAPGSRRAATAGAVGAGAGVAGDRWYHEPGALDAPESERERVAAREAPAGDAQGTRDHHHVGEAAAVGAGAAGAAAVAHHHHEHEAQRERVAEESATGEPVGREPVARDGEPLDREGTPIAGSGQGGSGQPGAGQAGYGEPIVAGAAASDRGEAQTMAHERGDLAAPGAAGARQGEFADEQPTSVRGAAGSENPTAGDANQPMQAGDVPAADPAAAGARGGAYTDHPTGRRRRGGLLSSLLRR